MAWFEKVIKKEDLPDPDTLDPHGNYTEEELMLFTEAILRRDREENGGESPGILFADHINNRKRREVTVPVPDETITHAQSKDGQTMYNRTHPEGRKVNSDKQRRVNGASYYRIMPYFPFYFGIDKYMILFIS